MFCCCVCGFYFNRHKLYGVVRREEFITNVNSIIQDSNNYSNYKNKMKTLIRDNQFGHFLKEIVWKPNIVLSMLSQSGDNSLPKPMLAAIEYNTKLYHFYFGALIHFANVTLKNDTKKSNQFLTNYFNYNNLIGLIDYQQFFGCALRNKRDLKICSFIMSNKCFNGIPDKVSYNRFIYNLFQYNKIDYMKLVLKYSKKNEQCIINCINNLPKESLTKLVGTEKEEEWFDILFKQLGELIPTKKAKIDEKVLEQGYQLCCQKGEKDERFNKLADVIVKYAKETNQNIDSKITRISDLQ